MSARITGDTIGAKELLAMAGEMATVHEREGRARNCLQRAAETVTSLATRLAEAERERDEWREKYDRQYRICQIIAGHRDDYRKEVARLAPLAAEAEAWEKITKVHGFQSVVRERGQWGVVIISGGGGSNVYRAPTAVALLERLDGLVKPEPEDWRWVWPDGSVSIESRPAAVSWMATRADRGVPGRPMRRTVDPVTGVVTLTPEGV